MYVYSITHSGANSNVFLNMVGHGSTGVVLIENTGGYYYDEYVSP